MLNGSDSLAGSFGDDSYDGGEGRDTARFNYDADTGEPPDFTSEGVTVDLRTGVATQSQGPTETLTGIENVRGSFAKDVIFGNDGRNFLWGGSANDVLRGLGGDDFLAGGSDNRLCDACSPPRGDALSGGAGFDRCRSRGDHPFLRGSVNGRTRARTMCLPGRSRVKVVAEGCSVFPTRTDRRSPLFRKELILVHKKCPARGASPCERAGLVSECRQRIRNRYQPRNWCESDAGVFQVDSWSPAQRCQIGWLQHLFSYCSDPSDPLALRVGGEAVHRGRFVGKGFEMCLPGTVEAVKAPHARKVRRRSRDVRRLPRPPEQWPSRPSLLRPLSAPNPREAEA